MNTERIHIRNRILVPQHRLLQAVPVNIDTRVAHIIIADLQKPIIFPLLCLFAVNLVGHLDIYFSFWF